MAAGVTSKLWSIYDIVNLIEARESRIQAAEASN
jgi:hypothetical protein